MGRLRFSFFKYDLQLVNYVRGFSLLDPHLAVPAKGVGTKLVCLELKSLSETSKAFYTAPCPPSDMDIHL